MALDANGQPAHSDAAIPRAEAAERYVRELVDTFPTLTQDQRARLAALLAGAPARPPTAR